MSPALFGGRRRENLELLKRAFHDYRLIETSNETNWQRLKIKRDRWSEFVAKVAASESDARARAEIEAWDLVTEGVAETSHAKARAKSMYPPVLGFKGDGNSFTFSMSTFIERDGSYEYLRVCITKELSIVAGESGTKEAGELLTGQVVDFGVGLLNGVTKSLGVNAAACWAARKAGFIEDNPPDDNFLEEVAKQNNPIVGALCDTEVLNTFVATSFQGLLARAGVQPVEITALKRVTSEP